MFTSTDEGVLGCCPQGQRDADGSRELTDVLLLQCSMDGGDIQAGIIVALGVGAVNADVVAVEARRQAIISSRGSGSDRPAAHAEANIHRLVSLTQRRLKDRLRQEVSAGRISPEPADAVLAAADQQPTAGLPLRPGSP